MQGYKNSFRNFLKKLSLLPLDNWNRFELKHGKKVIYKNNLVKIRQKVGKKSGIYVYKKQNKVLYIGKAVSLFGRMKSHNYESIANNKPVHEKARLWHKFFSQIKNTGRIKIFWKEIEKEQERQILEKMLEYVIESEFEKIRGKRGIQK